MKGFLRLGQTRVLFLPLLIFSSSPLECEGFLGQAIIKRRKARNSSIALRENPPDNEHFRVDSTRRQSVWSAAIMFSTISGAPLPSHAGLFAQKPRRQLELCIVSLLRVTYWAEKAIKDLMSENVNIRKDRYLEARLASKAMVTRKLGGGANYQVYTLNSLQVKDCLADLVSYADDVGKNERRKAEDLQTDLIEALASVVEFDGLETTLDPSPRSSLTLTMYTEDKAKFVQRTLSERVVPPAKALTRLFGPNVETQCVAYVQDNYPNEVPEAPDNSTQ